MPGTLIMNDPQPVVCDSCKLLVGWAETAPKPFTCIPCFDKVTIIRTVEFPLRRRPSNED